MTRSGPGSAVPEESGKGDRPSWSPLGPLTAWLGLVQQFGTASLGSVEEVTRLSQAQWDMMRDGMALMSRLPMDALEESSRELARLRTAVHAVQAQMAVFDEQLGALEQMLSPLHQWADAWRGLVQPPAPPGPPATSP
jgi:hypothetical protein